MNIDQHLLVGPNITTSEIFSLFIIGIITLLVLFVPYAVSRVKRDFDDLADPEKTIATLNERIAALRAKSP
jgi:hypothetical protein